MSLRIVAKMGMSAVAAFVGGFLLSQPQQQYPPGYAGNQTIYGGPGHAQPNIVPVKPPPQQQRIPGQAYTVRVQPCGEFGKPPCGTVVTIPANATGESLFAMAKTSTAAGRSWEAIIYIDEAAMLGYEPAEAALGAAFLEGKSAPQSLPKARYWLTKAADQGDVPSQTVVGEMYERAQGGASDLTKAVQYYESAAARHNAHAEWNLGLDYELAYGVPHDRARAIAMLRRASADGWPEGLKFANALSRAHPAQFRSEQELYNFVYPPQPGQAANVPPGCPGLLNYSVGEAGFMRKGAFCSYHPGCPIQIGGLTQMCPQYTGATLYQIMHDN
jgi:hypothetical protein